MSLIFKIICEICAEYGYLESVNLIFRSIPKIGRKSLNYDDWYNMIKKYFTYEKRLNEEIIYIYTGYIYVIKYKNGLEQWCYNGQLHRQNKPAVINRKLGIEEWWLYGELHRKNGPAVINRKTGLQKWWNHGLLHRYDGPAIIDPINKEKLWYRNGLLHRDNGPAIINKYREEWFREGLCIRVDDYIF